MGKITRKELSPGLNQEMDNFMPLDASADIATIKTNVGSNDDVANAIGSVHAKLKDVKASIVAATSPIKSVQRGTANSIGIDSVAADVNVTIAAVNLSKTFVNLNSSYGYGQMGTGTNANHTAIRVYLSSSTNLVISRPRAYYNDSVLISWEVVEFN